MKRLHVIHLIKYFNFITTHITWKDIMVCLSALSTCVHKDGAVS